MKTSKSTQLTHSTGTMQNFNKTGFVPVVYWGYMEWRRERERERERAREREREIVRAKADSCLAASQTQLNVHPVLSGTQCNYSTLQKSNYPHMHKEMDAWQSRAELQLTLAKIDLQRFTLWFIWRLQAQYGWFCHPLIDSTQTNCKTVPLKATGWRSGSINMFWEESEWSTLWQAKEKDTCVELEVREKEPVYKLSLIIMCWWFRALKG